MQWLSRKAFCLTFHFNSSLSLVDCIVSQVTKNKRSETTLADIFTVVNEGMTSGKKISLTSNSRDAHREKQPTRANRRHASLQSNTNEKVIKNPNRATTSIEAVRLSLKEFNLLSFE